MADEIPLIVERDGKALTLSLNNVDKKNALTSEIMGALSAILEDVENYEDLRVIIIKGRGSVFCSEPILTIGILKNCRSCYFLSRLSCANCCTRTWSVLRRRHGPSICV